MLIHTLDIIELLRLYFIIIRDSLLMAIKLVIIQDLFLIKEDDFNHFKICIFLS